jgi:ribosomal protein S18 acetylase RimI-like enzyme
MTATVRRAAEPDAPAIAAVHVRTWQAAYAHALPAAYLGALDAAERAATWRERLAARVAPVETYVVEVGGTVVGFVAAGPGRGEEAVGEVYAIYVEPGHWSTGAGRLLMQTAVTHLAAAGFTTVRLWVLEDNPRARDFYARNGFAADGASRPETIGGVDVIEVRYSMEIGGRP